MEKGLFFDGVEYGAGDMVSYLGHMCTDGVIMDAETSLKVVTSGGLSVRVQPGVAYVSGYCYVVDSGGVTLTTTSGTRTDIVVVKLDLVTRTLRAVIKQGESNAGDNEIPLARLSVNNGTVTVTDAREASRLKVANMASNVCSFCAGPDFTSWPRTETELLRIPIPGGAFDFHDIVLRVDNADDVYLCYRTDTGDFATLSGILENGGQFTVHWGSGPSYTVYLKITRTGNEFIVRGYMDVNYGAVYEPMTAIIKSFR